MKVVFGALALSFLFYCFLPDEGVVALAKARMTMRTIGARLIEHISQESSAPPYTDYSQR